MSTTKQNRGWLVLLYGLPTKQTAQRVNLWRKLKRCGAVQLKNSAYLLPDEPRHHERFQWLAEQVREGGGDATLLRVSDIEGLPRAQVVKLFNDARAHDYQEIIASLKKFLKLGRKHPAMSAAQDLDKLRRRLYEVVQIDYFDCSAGREADMLIQQAQGLFASKTKPSSRMDARRFTGKTWLTRPRPEIDRVGSAWLIHKFIDPRARFVFASRAVEHPRALPFDMPEVEFSHHGEDCTFETLVKRFGIEDQTIKAIAEMVHDADLEDDKFHRNECIGLDRILKGWGELGRTDEEILAKGFECFDALYSGLRG